MSDEKGRSLTRAEFDAVVRRAAELASSDSDTSEGELTEAELFRIAGEVGLEEAHVRLALAEVRSGAPQPHAVIDRLFGSAQIRAARVVPGTPDALSQKLDDFMVSTQLLQRVRRTGNVLQYRPAADWASHVARAASVGRKYYVAAAKTVEVQLDAVAGDRTLVSLIVAPGTRGNELAGAIVGGALASAAAGTGSAFGVAVFAAGVWPLAVGAVVGAGVWSAIFFGTAAAHRRKVADVRTEVEGGLDALETGASLEPPPPAWRKWVKKHFHGVARDILGEEEARAAKRREP
jgi:hypothetical protein